MAFSNEAHSLQNPVSNLDPVMHRGRSSFEGYTLFFICSPVNGSNRIPTVHLLAVRQSNPSEECGGDVTVKRLPASPNKTLEP